MNLGIHDSNDYHSPKFLPGQSKLREDRLEQKFRDRGEASVGISGRMSPQFMFSRYTAYGVLALKFYFIFLVGFPSGDQTQAAGASYCTTREPHSNTQI